MSNGKRKQIWTHRFIEGNLFKGNLQMFCSHRRVAYLHGNIMTNKRFSFHVQNLIGTFYKSNLTRYGSAETCSVSFNLFVWRLKPRKSPKKIGGTSIHTWSQIGWVNHRRNCDIKQNISDSPVPPNQLALIFIRDSLLAESITYANSKQVRDPHCKF